MKITLNYRNPTPSHCNVVVFINGDPAGTLTLRHEEMVHFQTIMARGIRRGIDDFCTTGDPTPPTSKPKSQEMTILHIDAKAYAIELARFRSAVQTYAAIDPTNIAIHGLGDILILSLQQLLARAERAPVMGDVEMRTCYDLMQRVPTP